MVNLLAFFGQFLPLFWANEDLAYIQSIIFCIYCVQSKKYQVYLLILSCLYFFISILIVIRSCMLDFFQVQSASTVPEPKAAETVNVDMTWQLCLDFEFWRNIIHI